MKSNENKVPQNIDKEAWGSENIAHSNLVIIMTYKGVLGVRTAVQNPDHQRVLLESRGEKNRRKKDNK